MVPRLLCPNAVPLGLLRLNAEQSHYLTKVLRLGVQAPVEAFDGRGARFPATIDAIDGKVVSLQLGAGRFRSASPQPRVWIAQGLATGDKMDWIIEKAVELSVDRVTPLECERSTMRLQGLRAEKKSAHWNALVEAACMQSQRDHLMALDPVQTFVSWVSMDMQADLKVMLDPSAGQSLLSCLQQSGISGAKPSTPAPACPATIVIVVGPESGFSSQELHLAHTHGFKCASLGSQILRTETAALVAAAKVQAWLDIL
jgi:16S rRNA (uracil1498-N3)-methyltransferase